MKFFNRNIGTIYSKELKDILRDRRTLFVAIILPIIINPLLIIGLLVLFSSQTEKEMQKSFTAVIIGEEHAPELSKIIREFNPNPFLSSQNAETNDAEDAKDSKIVKLVKIEGKTSAEILEKAIKRLETEDDDRIDIIIKFPDRFEERLNAHETPLEPELIFLGTSDRSTTAKAHISGILRGFVKEFEPIILKSTNIRQGSVAIKEVAKIIPYIMILMILTAAFTPAIDLMAGEKERGTIETLLITPADRSEIVLGKFYTVFTVAISATILNLASLGVTVSFAKNILQSSMKAAVKTAEISEKNKEKLNENSLKSVEKTDKDKKVTLQTVAKTEKTQSQPPNDSEKGMLDPQKQMQQQVSGQIQFPSMPFILFPVLLLMMIPAAALFGAIALALSSFAKSYKEGQYYITPLMMVAIPLSMVSLLPGIQFNFWLGITPITNLSLIFRDIMTNITVHGSGGISSLNWGNILTVLISTTFYALLALKWAKDVFYREDVLFREAEELNWKFWRTAGPPKDVPSISTAILAFLISFILFMFIGQLWQVNAIQEGSTAFIRAMIKSQVLLIALPAVIILRMNKHKIKKVFPVSQINIKSLIGIVLIIPALSLLMIEFQKILQIFGMKVPAELGFLDEFFNENNIITGILILAVLPGICEEILFRGFIFSGFVNNVRGSKITKGWKAILLSSMLFAIMHVSPIRIPITFIGGVVLAFMFWRTRNLLVSMIAHILYNSMSLILGYLFECYPNIWNIKDEHMPIWLIIITFVSIAAGVVLFSQRIIDEDEKSAESDDDSKKIVLFPKPESEEL